MQPALGPQRVDPARDAEWGDVLLPDLAEIADLAANVNLWARTAKSDEEAVGTFTFKIPSLGAYESKDMTATLNTKLRVYELPDWQNLTAEIQITSPE